MSTTIGRKITKKCWLILLESVTADMSKNGTAPADPAML